jgi:hypothetical protein
MSKKKLGFWWIQSDPNYVSLPIAIGSVHQLLNQLHGFSKRRYSRTLVQYKKNLWLEPDVAAYG